MEKLLIWLYVSNAVLLINHEIDSAYWQEWHLMRLPGGITGFLLLHFPLLLLVLWGLLQVYDRTRAGLIISLILSISGIFAFTVHTYFLSQGRPEFQLPISILILVATLVVSLIQGGVSIYTLRNNRVLQVG